MNEPHIIRLRGPWQRVVKRTRLLAPSETGDKSISEESATVRMPGGWADDLGRDFDGVVLYERMFNRPTNLSPHTDVRLCLREVVGASTQVRLNGNVLGAVAWPDRESEFDLTGRLEPRNRLEVEIDSLPRNADGKPLAQGLVGEVHLEIR